MDPQLKSICTSILLAAATAIAAWAAGHGIIPGSQQGDFANMLVTVAFGLGAAGIAWYKKRQQSQEVLIKAVNAADNGVKVVADTAPAPVVNAPISTK